MRTEDKIIDLIDRQDWLENVSHSTQKAVKKATRKRGTAANSVQKALHGNLVGFPLHPVLNDIPIGAWTTASVLEVMEISTGRAGFGKAANTAVGVGIVGSTLAALAGLADWSYTSGRTRRVGMLHALLNTVTMLIFGVSLLAGNQNRGLRRGLRFLGLATLGISGYLGNHIAYHDQALIRNAPRRERPEEIMPVLAER